MIFHNFCGSYPFYLFSRHTVEIGFIPCDGEAKPGITQGSNLNSVAHLYNLARNLKSCHDTTIQCLNISIISSVYDKHFSSILTIVFTINKVEVPIARVAVIPQ